MAKNPAQFERTDFSTVRRIQGLRKIWRLPVIRHERNEKTSSAVRLNGF